MKKITILKSISCFALIGTLFLGNVNSLKINAQSFKYDYDELPKNFKSLTLPTVVPYGESCSIGGEVQIPSDYANLGDFYIGIKIYDENTDSYRGPFNFHLKQHLEKGTTYFNLGFFDRDLIFGSLRPGYYKYDIFVSRNSHPESLYRSSFIISSGAVGVKNIGFRDFTVPSSIKKGNCFSLTGDIHILCERFNKYDKDGLNGVKWSTYPYRMEARVKKLNNKTGKYELIKYPDHNIWTYDTGYIGFKKRTDSMRMPKIIDNSIIFNWLDSGNYTLTYSFQFCRNNENIPEVNYNELHTWKFRVY